MANISEWSTTAASNNSTPPDGAPEGMQPSAVNNVIRENMAAVRTQMEDAAWFDWGDTPTYVTATTFTISGDVTARYTVGRAIKCYGPTMGTLERHITASSYSSPNTTVTVDSGSLLADLNQVYLGIITNNGDSLPSTLSINKVVAGDGGLFCGSNRNTRTVILDTPTLLGSSTKFATSAGPWATHDAPTINSGTPIAAIIRCRVKVTSGTTLGNTAQGGIGLRKTGSGASFAGSTTAVSAVAECVVAGVDMVSYSHSDSFVALDGNYDYDYYLDATITGTGSVEYDRYLLGYIQEC